MHEPPLILVVDDAPALALVLSKSLTKAGYEVIVAGDGFRAVELAVDRSPDLILLDMMMPGRDGLETCRLLKADQKTSSIPVIFVTAHAATESVVQAFAVGGADYVTKPFRVDEVLSRVSVHLRLREAEQELVMRNGQLEILMGRLAEANDELARQSRIDPLTKLLNRRAWDESGSLEHERCVRQNRTYTVLMIDIDHFKALNDSRGHQVGDECLRRVAECIGATCRNTDLVGRYGGEEFVVLVSETAVDAGASLAERIRQAVWELGLQNPGSSAGRVSISIGVAAAGHLPLEAAVGEADAALYLAKQGGRNLVYFRGRGGGTAEAEAGEATTSVRFDAKSEETHQPLVLVVSGDPAKRSGCRSAIQNSDLVSEEAIDGHSALRAVTDFRPDVILLDTATPGMDGFECARRLKANAGTADVPIILIGASHDSSAVVAGLAAGADDFLTWSVDSDELVARAQSMVRLFRDRRDLLRSYHLRAEQINVLMTLVDLCRAVGAATKTDDILEHAVAAVAEITASRRVSIMLPSEDRTHLVIARCHGLSEELVAEVRVPVGQAIAGTVFTTRRAIVCETQAEVTRHKLKSETEFFTGVPLMSAPLASGGEMLGVVNATERVGGRPYQPHELEYIELIANVAGAALYSMQTRQARDDARDLVVVALAKLAEHRDNDTARHVERVTVYAQALARQLRRTECFVDQIDDEFIDDLGRAVPLHDIGKVAIPDSILLKPGKLTVHEMAIMRTHAEIGAETLRPIIAKAPDIRFLRLAADIMHAHHEWYDGTGYPLGLSGLNIPLAARIVAVADVYDAITTRRVYKDAICHDKAAAIIFESSGTQFDPAAVEAFRECEPEFIRLAGELADQPTQPAGAGVAPSPVETVS